MICTSVHQELCIVNFWNLVPSKKIFIVQRFSPFHFPIEECNFVMHRGYNKYNILIKHFIYLAIYLLNWFSSCSWNSEPINFLVSCKFHTLYYNQTTLFANIVHLLSFGFICGGPCGMYQRGFKMADRVSKNANHATTKFGLFSLWVVSRTFLWVQP